MRIRIDRRIISILLMIAFPSMASTLEDIQFDFKQEICLASSPPALPDINVSIKPPRSLHLGVESSFTCLTEARNPEVNLYSYTLTVSVETYSPIGKYGMCTCRARMDFNITLPDELEKLPHKIYFVQDGVVRGEIDLEAEVNPAWSDQRN